MKWYYHRKIYYNIKKQFFGDVVFWDDKILACYSEGKNNLPNEDLPTQLLVFDITGDYLRTLETGYRIVDLCLDEQNNRLILHLDDEIQFGYITLNDDLYK